MTVFLQNLINALQWGSFYALIAIGYSMVYSILMLFNFAHGDIFMAGAYLLISHDLIRVVAGIVLIGTLNFSVSFALALRVALQARGVAAVDRRRLLRGILRALMELRRRSSCITRARRRRGKWAS